MILRNYDNFITYSKMGFTNSRVPSDGYGDGFLGIKDYLNRIITAVYVNNDPPFSSFAAMANGIGSNIAGSNLICGYEENEVTYDDYTIDNVNLSLNYTSHLSSQVVYDEETNTYTREYYKTFTNNTETPITINCVGVYYGTAASYTSFLVYKEKLPEPVMVDGYGSIQLKFQMTVSGTPNKPMEISVSTE